MHVEAVAPSSDDGAALRPSAMARGWMYWACCIRNGPAVFADPAMPVADNHWRSMPLVWNDSIGAGSLAFRSLVIAALPTVWSPGVLWGTCDSRDVGATENSSGEHRESSRCSGPCTSRCLMDLEYRV